MPAKRKVMYGQSKKAKRARKRRPAYGPYGAQQLMIPRVGFGSVARARGAAVTGEMKYFDCEKDATAISAVTTTWVAGTITDPGTTINLGDAAVATPLCLIAPKVSAALNGRIGRKIRVLKVKVHGHFVCPLQSVAATGDNPCKIRMFLVLDTQTNAAQMTSAQLLNDAGSAATTINTFQNPNNFGRFRVLKEKMFLFQNPNITGAATVIEQQGLIQAWKLSYIFKGGLMMNFNATNGGTVADIIDNSLHIICGASNTTLAPQIQYYSRVCYKE
jgi:hypothetical protein